LEELFWQMSTSVTVVPLLYSVENILVDNQLYLVIVGKVMSS